MKVGQWAVFWFFGLVEDTINPKPRKIAKIEDKRVFFEEEFSPRFAFSYRIIAVFDDLSKAEAAIRAGLLAWKIQSAIVSQYEDALTTAKAQRDEVSAGAINATVSAIIDLEEVPNDNAAS